MKSPAHIAARLLENDDVQGGLPEDDSLDAKVFAMDMANLPAAVACYRGRKSRRLHPKGSFEKNGTWWPAESEACPCCASIRAPTRSFPWSLMHHCRTVVHVANLHKVPVELLKKAVR